MEWFRVSSREELERLIKNDVFGDNENLINLAKMCLKAGGELYVDDKEFARIVKCKISRRKPVQITLRSRREGERLSFMMIGEIEDPHLMTTNVLAYGEVMPDDVITQGTHTYVDLVPPNKIVITAGKEVEIEVDEADNLSVKSSLLRIE